MSFFTTKPVGSNLKAGEAREGRVIGADFDGGGGSGGFTQRSFWLPAAALRPFQKTKIASNYYLKRLYDDLSLGII